MVRKAICLPTPSRLPKQEEQDVNVKPVNSLHLSYSSRSEERAGREVGKGGVFARLTHEYKLPVYPIVLFSFDAPLRAQPAQYVVEFPDKTVLKFDYTAIQLNRLPWRRFLKSANPVAIALMAKMRIAVKERPKARAELLRLLAGQRYDPASAKLLGLFIDRYLVLTAGEMRKFEREVAGFDPAERGDIVELKTSWELEGELRGEERGERHGGCTLGWKV